MMSKAIQNATRNQQVIRDFVVCANDNWQDTDGCHACVRGRKIAFSLQATEIRSTKHDHLAIIWWGNQEFSFGCTILTKDCRIVQLISDEEMKEHKVI